MMRVTLKGLWAHKRRLVGTCSAVVLGVAFLAATLVVGDTMRTGFDELFTTANAGTDVVVRGAVRADNGEIEERRMVDLALVDQLAAVDGVTAVAPEIEGVGQLVGADGNPIGGNGPPTIAANWIADPSINPYHLVDGRAPAASGEVVIDERSADVGDLAVGSETVVRVPEPVDVEVVGIAMFGESDSMSGSTYAAFTFEEARRLLAAGQPQVSAVLLQGDGAVSQDELLARVAPQLPDGVEALTGAELSDEQLEQIGADFLDFMQMLLLVFTGIALLVATFSIYNTFSVIVSQRSREAALLRAVGASRAQVLRSVVVEALVVGALASVAGFGLGLLLGQVLLGAIESMGADLPGSGLTVDASAAVIALATGLVVTLLASVVPAIRAARVAPLAALRDVGVERTARPVVRVLIGGAAMAAGVVLVVLGGSGDGSLPFAGLGAVLALVGTVVVGPLVARLATRIVRRPLTVARGVVGELAASNAGRNPKRTASTASALMVGVAVVSLFTVFASSVKASMASSIDTSFQGDLVIAATDFSGSRISPAVAEDLATLPEVEAVTGIGAGVADMEGEEDMFSTADLAALDQLIDLDVAAGEMADVNDGGFAVSDSVAEDRGWDLGTSVTFDFVDGASEELTVDAIYRGDDLIDGVVVPRETWDRHAVQVIDDVVLLSLTDGVSVTDGREAVSAVADEHGAPAVQDADEFLDTVSSQVDQMLVVVYVMLALSILIAVMGIANTMSLSIHERTRELGLLRAVGQTRRQVRAMVRWESAMIALLGTLTGVALGVFFGWGLMRAVAAVEGLGTFDAPAGQLAIVVLAGAAAGILAGIRPARRAARLDVLDAIATE